MTPLTILLIAIVASMTTVVTAAHAQEDKAIIEVPDMGYTENIDESGMRPPLIMTEQDDGTVVVQTREGGTHVKTFNDIYDMLISLSLDLERLAAAGSEEKQEELSKK